MKSHSFDPISFFSGLVIALIGALFLIPATPVDVVEALVDLGSWFWPTLLVVIGIAVLIPALASGKKEE